MQSAEDVIEAGTVLLGKYRIESVLGRGGMGMVYRAHHLSLDETVAIKVLRQDVSVDEETVHRFVREAQSAVKLKSEHVAQIRDVGTFDDGLPFMVMEFLEGADLGQLVETNGALNVPVAADLMLQACEAIAEAHSLGIVHRDIKPSNLFVSFRPDETTILKVLDFGISKSATGADLSLTQTSSMLGTPAYMSPEQMRSARTVDARTDIWSIGTVLYELVEARRPFNAESFSEMCVMVAIDPPSPMVHAPELAPIIMRCLAKNPDERYANVPDLMRELAAFAGNPEAARHLVTRAYRVLGLPVPRSLDSSPSINVPMPPLPATPPTRTAAPTVATTIAYPPHKSSRSLVTVLALCLLLGIGGAIGYLKLTEEPAVAAGADPSSGSAIESASNAAAGSGSVAGSGSESGSGSVAGSDSGSVAGSGSESVSGSGSGSGSNSVAGSESESRSGSGSGSGSGSVAGSGSARAGSASTGSGSRTVSKAGGKPPKGGGKPPKGGGKPPKGAGSADAGTGSGAVVPPKPKCDPFNSVRDGC